DLRLGLEVTLYISNR
ncbi:pyrroloquinoline quinone precursor peptide PqqA, partial [Serratia marcescens]